MVEVERVMTHKTIREPQFPTTHTLQDNVRQALCIMHSQHILHVTVWHVYILYEHMPIVCIYMCI